MSKAEFALAEVGKECVTEKWLEGNLPEENDKEGGEQKLEQKSRIKLVGEKNAADFSWSGPLMADKEKEIEITVQDKKFVHHAQDNPTVTFLVFHKGPTGWGEAIQEPGKRRFKGPGGHVEKTELPVKQSGGEWIGKATILPQKSIAKFALWESPTGGSDNSHITLQVQVLNKKGLEILKFTEEQPSLEEVVDFIDTPKELLTFMNSYFINKFREGHLAYSPGKFLKAKKGDCKDWSVFSAYILKENGYKAKQLVYSPKSKKGAHVISIYWEEEGLYYITTKLVGAQLYGPFQDIEEILQHEVERRTDLADEEITCYTLAPPTKLKVEKRCLFAEPG